MPSNLKIVENFLNLIKSTYEKPIAKIIFQSEILTFPPLKSGTKEGWPFLPPIVQAIAVKQ